MTYSATATIARGPVAAHDAREWLRRRLAEADARCVEDVAVLVISELVTNAVIHGEDAIEVGITSDPPSVFVAVTDHGGGAIALRAAAPDALSGRGLNIVQRSSTDWGVSSVSGVKTVWALLTLPGDGTRSAAAPSRASALRSP